LQELLRAPRELLQVQIAPEAQEWVWQQQAGWSRRNPLTL
jgi:hypothetical protein